MRGAIFWGARPSRVLVLLSRQHELLTNSETKRKVRRRETQRPTRSPRRIRPVADGTRVLPDLTQAVEHNRLYNIRVIRVIRG